MSFSRTYAELCIYHFFVMVKFKFLAHLLLDHAAYPVVSSLIPRSKFAALSLNSVQVFMGVCFFLSKGNYVTATFLRFQGLIYLI